MCGIFGVIEKSKVDKKKACHALNLLSHRGPDNTSFFWSNGIFLGHTRLSILDLSEKANQPMKFGNLIIVYNGEIYNHLELREKYLKDYEFKTSSDTETLLYLYHKLGRKCLHLLNGMFSFAIYDRVNKKIELFRDRFGKKPLYFCKKGDLFIFSSEIKSILYYLPNIPEINKKAFMEYLTFWAPLPDETFYKEIRKLPAGFYLSYSLRERRIADYNSYYELPLKTDHSIFSKTKEDLINETENLLLSSVNYRLLSDVEVGAFLSGGIDSSLVVSMYSTLSDKKIRTFSIGYSEHKRYDELNYAELVAEKVGTEHTSIVVTKEDFIEASERILDFLDEPVSDPACIPTYILSQKVKEEEIKVILTGEGSDEIFLGYDNYFKVLDFYLLQNSLDKNLKEKLLGYHEKQRNLTREWEFFRRAFSDEIIYRSNGENFTDFQKVCLLREVLKPEKFSSQEVLYSKFPAIKSISNFSLLLSFIDLKVWIAEVLMTKLDRMTMAHSVEARAPFLDYRLVEFVLRIPQELRLGNTTKALLKPIAEKYLPHSIVYRKKKGFSSPFLEWYYDVYGKEILVRLKRMNDELGWFKKDFLEFLFSEGQKGHFKLHMWSLILFEKWFSKIYGGRSYGVV